MFKFLRKPTINEFIDHSIDEAERNALLHEAMAEQHDAMATMYRGRIERLKAQLEGRQPRAKITLSEIVAASRRPSTTRVLPEAEAAAPAADVSFEDIPIVANLRHRSPAN